MSIWRITNPANGHSVFAQVLIEDIDKYKELCRRTYREGYREGLLGYDLDKEQEEIMEEYLVEETRNMGLGLTPHKDRG